VRRHRGGCLQDVTVVLPLERGGEEEKGQKKVSVGNLGNWQ
jgi:hypothetical protein